MSWKDLDIKLKAELIKLGVLSGIRDIKLIRLLYDDNNTPTLVVELSYNETNVMPLLGIERIKLEYGIPEEEINKTNEILQLIENEISLEEINNQQPVLFRLFSKGGYISNNPTLALIGKVKKYEEGGLKDSNIILDYIFNGPLKRKKENSLEYRQALFNNVDPRNGYPSPWTAVKYYNTVVDALNSGDNSKKWETDGSIGQETAAAGWAKYLDLPYNKELFPVWNGDTVRLSPELEREIPIDTNLLKLDILEIRYNRDMDRSMGIFDREEAYKTLLLTKQLSLNNLRKTYKTGEWVQMNEFMGNSVNPFDWNEDYVSPLNVLLFYGLKYDKNTNSMLYGDLYNLNAFDYFLPGKPFIIRGAIPLDKKKNGGKVKKYSKGGYKNPDEPPVLESTYVELPTLNILELELLNYLLSNSTAEQEYFRNLAVLNMSTPQSNLGVILTKEEQDLVDKAFLGYNNFRYSHPWMEGLNYTPIIGDGMDLISLAGAVNNKDYMTAGLGLGMIALPNFIEKPLKKSGIKSLNTIINDVVELLSPQEKFIRQMYSDELHGAGWSDNIRIKNNQKYLQPFHINLLDNQILKRMRRNNFQKDSDIEEIKKWLSNIPYYEYPEEYFYKAGYPKVSGWHLPWDNRIVYNIDVPSIKVLPHEYRHLIDQYYPLNNSNKIYLNRAYKDYFTNLDLTSKDGFASDISNEMVTTNLDTRILFFRGKKVNVDGEDISLVHAPIELLNLAILLASTEEIIKALEDSNGYGLKFAYFLKNKGDKYIEQKIPFIKDALSNVPSLIPFGLMSYKLFNQNNKEEYKNGGFLFPNLVFSHKFEK